MKELWRLAVIARPYWWWMALSVVLTLLTVSANIALLATSGWFITAMGLAGAAGAAMNYFTPAAMIRAFAIARTGGRYAERIVSHEATFRIISALRVWLFERLEPLAPAGLGDNRSGDLLTRLRADVERLEQAFLRLVSPVVVALVASLLAVAVIAAYSSALAICLLFLLLFGGLILPIALERAGRAPSRRVAEGSADLNVALVDMLGGLAELEAYGATGDAAARISTISDDTINQGLRLARLNGLGQAGMGLAASLALWFALVLLIPGVASGHQPGAEFVMLAFLAWSTFEAVAPVPQALHSLGGVLASARRIFAIADAPPPVPDPAKPGRLPPSRELCFKAVSLRYPGRRRAALDGIDFCLAPGRHVGVLGPSGSGKSSLIALAMRFHAPSSGAITLGEVPLDRLSGEDVRRQIAVVPQDVHLFTTTIAENLAIARPDANRAQVEAACRIAQLHDFIEAQPEGYDTFVGTTGIKLSGGQIRRLAVARALLKDAPILILDEPTEGLDTVTERALMSSVLTSCRDKAVLVISHRPAALELLDELVTLDRGRIISRGPPADVLPL